MASRISVFVSAHLKRKRKDIYPAKIYSSLPTDFREVVLAEVLKKTGISIERDENFSDRVCNPCARNICSLGSLYTLADRRNITENSRETQTAHEKTDENNNWNFPAPTSPSHASGREFAVKPIDLASAICSSINSRGAGTEKWSFRSPPATEKVWQWIIAIWHLLKKTW